MFGAVRSAQPSLDSGRSPGAGAGLFLFEPYPRSRVSNRNEDDGRNTGRIIEIKGVVIDAVFTERAAGDLHALSRSRSPEPGGCDAHADRGGAAAPRRRSRPRRRHGLDRRSRARRRVRRHGGADLRPRRRRRRSVGSGTSIGDPIDEQGDLPEGAERWPIHRDPPAFRDLSPKIEIFETGIKVIDLIAPFVKGGKVGLFGGAGARQDRADPGADPQRRAAARRRVGLRRRRRADARGERPLARDDRVGRPRQGRARLRPDERAAGRAAARRASRG